MVDIIFRWHSRGRGSNLRGVDNFISALKSIMLGSTTSVSLAVVKSLHGSRLIVKCCVYCER